MIYYLCDRKHQFTVTTYLNTWGKEIAPFFEPLPYNIFLRRKKHQSGTYIFSDLERLTRLQHKHAANIACQLSSIPSRYTVVNQPDRYLNRLEMLRALHRRGINVFNVYRPWELAAIKKFPVFVRAARIHTGPLTELLNTRWAVILALLRPRVIRRSEGNMLIAEYVDVSDEDGLFHKYAAYRIADRMVAAHVERNHNWSVKLQDSHDGIDVDRLVSDNLDYIKHNPHARQLMAIFELAGIEYGRIDYAVDSRGLIIFEINTNPHIILDKEEGGPRWREQVDSVCQSLNDAFYKLNRSDE